jgi:pimeloyl-ACP methyl ester carboxylesterase
MNFRRPAQSRTIGLSRLDMHYLDWPGSEPAIVLLHPNRTNARVWDFVVDASARASRFIAPDQRGHGLSEYPESGYELDDYVADTIELADRLGLGRVVLVGAATGGNIALLIAGRVPERVAALIVADAGLSLDPVINARVQKEIKHAFRFKNLATAKAQMPFSALWSEAMREHYARHSFKPLPSGEVEWRYHVPGASHTEHRLEEDMWHRIEVACPTLILRGDRSAVFPPANAAKLQRLIPGSETATVTGCDHRISQDQPEQFAHLIDEFLARRLAG